MTSPGPRAQLAMFEINEASGARFPPQPSSLKASAQGVDPPVVGWNPKLRLAGLVRVSS